MASVRAIALSSMAVRVVTTGFKIGDDFYGPDSGRDVIFNGAKDLTGYAKDRTDDNLGGFCSGSVDDKEQHL